MVDDAWNWGISAVFLKQVELVRSCILLHQLQCELLQKN